jgi:hypothetical protein
MQGSPPKESRMKMFRLWLLAVATMLVPLSAHATYFELKLEATRFDLNAGKFTVQKRKLSTHAFIAKVMNIPPEDAAGLTLPGKTDTGLGPIAAKGSCVGSFTTDAMEFCRIDGAIGKRFVEKGPCLK